MRGWITVVESENRDAVVSPELILQASRSYQGPLLITSLELDEELLAKVVQLSGAGSISAAVNLALQQYIDLGMFQGTAEFE